MRQPQTHKEYMQARLKDLHIKAPNGQFFNKVRNPAVVFDVETGRVYKIGEFDTMLSFYNHAQYTCVGNGLSEKPEHIMLLNLPKKQEVIDKVCFEDGYVLTLYEELVIQPVKKIDAVTK